MLSLVRDIRDLQRLRRILTVFFEQGLGYYITKSKLRSHLPFHKQIQPTFPITDKKRQAIKLREAFEKLGPTFVKLGQLLSLRPDLVPEEFVQEFSKLQDNVPPFPYKEVRRIIQEDFEKPINKLFKTFSTKPFASASIAQVHKATLKNGKIVAVKVQRPEVKKVIDADLDILFLIAKSLEKHFPSMRAYQPVEVVKEFALWTRRELNFKIEAHNAMQLQDELKNNKSVKVPKVYLDYSSRNVLTMEFIDGVKIDNLTALSKMKVNMKKLAMTYFCSILEQSLLYGLFHADPHPANIFVQRNGKMVYLDFGIMGELIPSDRKKVIKFIASIPEENPEKSLDILISLAREIKTDDLTEFKHETLSILRDVYTHSVQERSMGKAFYDIIGLGAKHGVIFDPSHVLMAKAVYQAEGLGLKLDPKFKVSKGFETFSKRYMNSQYSPLVVAKKVKGAILTHKDLLFELPDHVVTIMKRLETPVEQHCDDDRINELEEQMEEWNHNRNVWSLLVILSLAVLFFFYLEGRTSLLGLNFSTILLIVIAVVLIYLALFHKRSWRD